jgi:hypothetical protein
MSTELQPVRTPLGSELLAAPGVAAWYAGLKAQIDTLGTVEERLRAIWQNHFARGNQIEVSGELSKEGKLELWQKLRQDSMNAIDKLFADAEKAVTELQVKINTALEPTKLTAEAALLEEMQLARAWTRIKGVLDMSGDAAAAARQVEQLATAAASEPGGHGHVTLKALREELPAYLQSRKFGVIIDSTLARLSQIEAPFLSPVGRAALQLAACASGGWQNICASMDMMRRAVSGTGGNPSRLPGFFAPEKMKF